MFGQDDKQQQSDQNMQQPVDQLQAAQAPVNDFMNPGAPVAPAPQSFASVVDPAGAPAQSEWQTPVLPDSTDWTAPVADTPSPVDGDSPIQNDDSLNKDLIDIKKKALSELSPLFGLLDQTPEEKFKTTMMMIQASDDQTLIPEAYASAQAITEEKVKAQALLDIVNEINYFTQHAN